MYITERKNKIKELLRNISLINSAECMSASRESTQSSFCSLQSLHGCRPVEVRWTGVDEINPRPGAIQLLLVLITSFCVSRAAVRPASTSVSITSHTQAFVRAHTHTHTHTHTHIHFEGMPDKNGGESKTCPWKHACQI